MVFMDISNLLPQMNSDLLRTCWLASHVRHGLFHMFLEEFGGFVITRAATDAGPHHISSEVTWRTTWFVAVPLHL